METVLRKSLIWVLVSFLALPGAPLSAAESGGQGFKPEEIDALVAPIALYPDELLSQIFMASTYPLEVVQAGRWARQNQNLKGDALAQALEKQDWDPSVKSLVNFPEVLSKMSDKLDWTQKLGDAFLEQQKEVMDAVQRLRAKAQAAGNLQTTEQQKVIVEEKVIKIEPASPQVVYVPTYNPTVVYGAWPYPAYPPIPLVSARVRVWPPCLPLGQALRSALPGDSRGAAPTGAAVMSTSTLTETPILIQTLIASRPSRISKPGGREKGAPSSMTRAIERASVTETTRLLRSSTGAVMLKRPRRAKIFAAGRRAAVKNWRVRAVPATAVVWERKVVLEIEAGWEIRGGQAIGVDWATRGGQEIVAAKVWEIEVLAWVTVGVRDRELELAQAIEEGSVVAVGEGVPSKAPAAEAVMHVAPAPAVPQAVPVVRVGEAPVPEAVVAPAAAVVAVVVAAVAGGAGKGLS